MKMNNGIFKSTFFSLVLLLSPLASFTYDEPDSWWSTGKSVASVIAGGIGAAVGVGLAVLAADAVTGWLHPSNKTIIDEGHKCLERRFGFQDSLMQVKNFHQITGQPLSDFPWIRTELNEQLIYAI